MFSFSIKTAKQGNTITISSFNNFPPINCCNGFGSFGGRIWPLITVKNLKTNNLINLCYSFV